MITDSSRISVYNYLSSLFSTVTPNLYSMSEPTAATESDTTNGFIVTHVGAINDESEFGGDAYGWVRCSVEAYVPKRERGRLNKTKYKVLEDGINDVIKANTGLNNDGGYYIMEDSILSMDDDENTQKGNQFHVFVKSFVVVIDQKENS